MKNRFLVLILFLFISLHVSSQIREKIINLENFDKQRLHWGYFLGFNEYDFKFEYQQNTGDVLVAKSIGFNVGLIGDLRLHEYVNLRLEPGLYYTERTLNFPNFMSDSDAVRKVPSTYIHIPLLLKISSKRLNNFRPYVLGGVSTSINLSSNENSVDDTSSGTFRMTQSTYYYELGVGVDFYLPYFKFSPSIRGVFGLSDELIPDNDPMSPWTSNINKLYTRGIFINFTFE